MGVLGFQIFSAFIFMIIVYRNYKEFRGYFNTSSPAHWLSLLAVTWAYGWFIAGTILFPEAPYKLCGTSVYCDKRGIHHTPQEYESYALWFVLLFIFFAFGAFAMYTIIKDGKRGQKTDLLKDGNV